MATTVECMKDFGISICMPALNEERGLREAVEDVLETLSPCIKGLELIIVNDGSTDATPQLAEQMARQRPQVRVIHHGKRMGIGACYRDALAIAKEDYFTWFPADHENSAEEFIQSLPYLSHDTVVTCHHWGRDNRFFLRRWVSRSYTWFLNRLFHLNVRYYNGLTTFPTAKLRSLPLVSDGFVFFAESLIRALKSGCRIIELSAPLRGRHSGTSKIFTLSSCIQDIKDVCRILAHRNKRIQYL